MFPPIAHIFCSDLSLRVAATKNEQRRQREGGTFLFAMAPLQVAKHSILALLAFGPSSIRGFAPTSQRVYYSSSRLQMTKKVLVPIADGR